MEQKEKKKIQLHELDGVYLSLQFLKHEPEECLTEYGKGLVNGLMDESTKKRCQVVIREDYEALEEERDYLEEELDEIKNKWWYKLFSKYL